MGWDILERRPFKLLGKLIVNDLAVVSFEMLDENERRLDAFVDVFNAPDEPKDRSLLARR